MKKLFAQFGTFSSVFLLSAPKVFANAVSISLSQPSVGVTNFSKLITSLFTAAVVFAALVMFAMLLMGGYAWMTAGGDKAKVEEARAKITNGLIGLAIVAAAWAIMTVVGGFFGLDITNFALPSASGA